MEDDMRTYLAILAIAGLVLLGFGAKDGAAAAQAYALDNEDLHINVASANDLHIQYFSDTEMTLVEAWSDKFPAYTATPSAGGTVWDITWSGPTRVFCDTVHVGVRFLQRSRNWLRKRNIIWTLNGVPQIPVPPRGAINGPGFQVLPPEGLVNRVIWRVWNNGPNPLTISQLQFLQAPTLVPLPQMRYNQLLGWSPPRPPLVVPPDSFFDVFVDIENGEGPFNLLAQGQVEIEGFWEGLFVQQHQHPLAVPAATRWGLLALALVMLVTAWVVVRRTRRSTT
jgi:hypothetical protein